MTISTLFVVAALIVAIVALGLSRFRDLAAWGVALLALAALLAAYGLRT